MIGRLRLRSTNRRAPLAVFLLSVLGVLPGCGSDSQGPPTPALDPTEVTFAASLGVNLAQMTKLPSGLYVQDLTVGDGAEASAGDDVLVEYSGWLPDATLFDASSIAGRPFGFTLGRGQVIPGWDEGVAGVRVGGTRLLVIPAGLAYGSRRVGAIPSNSVLVFRVMLIDVT